MLCWCHCACWVRIVFCLLSFLPLLHGKRDWCLGRGGSLDSPTASPSTHSCFEGEVPAYLLSMSCPVPFEFLGIACLPSPVPAASLRCSPPPVQIFFSLLNQSPPNFTSSPYFLFCRSRNCTSLSLSTTSMFLQTLELQTLQLSAPKLGSLDPRARWQLHPLMVFLGFA